MSVVFPPGEADFLCLVDRADDQADADGQELHFRQRDLDVTRDRQPLVEDAIKDVDEAPDAVTVGRRSKVFHHRRRTKYGTNARKDLTAPTNSHRVSGLVDVLDRVLDK